MVVQSGSSRTDDLSSISRRHAHALVDVTPMPATAAAIAPSFSFVEKPGSRFTVTASPHRSNFQAFGTADAGPPTIRCSDSALGWPGVPNRAR